VDVKGFFDHIHHDRLIYVLWEKGFCAQTCNWVRSFVSGRQAVIWLDDYISTLKAINIGLAQGLPISPVLACLYTSEPLEQMIEEPSYSTSHTNTKRYNWPIGPRAYVDDHGLLSIGDNWETNNEHLAKAAKRLTDLLSEIGLKIDPRKSEIMHFSVRRNEKPPPPLVLDIYGTRTELLPPKEGYLRWLGAFLDKKLSWKLHTTVMNKRGTTILSGMKCLGNTIRGHTQQNRRTLYLSCILPVVTYAAPVWFRPDKQQKHLLEPLVKIQSEALRWTLGVFRTTPLPALNILAHVPPIC